MLPDQTDRRHPRVSVADLRRDLREADADRFTKTRTEPARRGRRYGPLMIALGVSAAVATVGWASRVPDAAGIGKNVRTQLPAAAAPQMQADLSATEIAVRAVEPQHPVEIQVPARHAPAAARSTRARTAQTARMRHHAPPAAHRRSVPRPLSPGEFGRPHVVFGN